ncbi:MAG: diacylglycerol kinase family protein, partial [Deltaproteobacteria bacterium]|nr:diacylglycerol kinase family protein [Deltaproteobacteria bacterium]
MAAKTTILLNPAAHQNGVGRAWEAVQRKSLEALSPAEIRVVGTREEARQAAADAAREGCEKIIAVGGAETSNGMVTAVMELAPTHRKALKIGFLS